MNSVLCRLRQSLVAEHPADLEHPVHAADDQPLEVQLEGDPQVQRHVEHVVVGDERAGVGTAGVDVQHRRLDLDVAALVERAPEAGDDLVAHVERAPGVGVDGEVDVALAEAGVRIGEAVPLVGQRAQRLGEQRRARSALTDSSPARVVITVPWTPTQSPRSSSLTAAKPSSPMTALETNSWTLGAALGDRGEHELARVALEHDAPGDADLVGGLGARLEVGPLRRAPSATLWVRSKRYGYGSPPAARMASTWPWRRARSAASPLPEIGASAGSSTGAARYRTLTPSAHPSVSLHRSAGAGGPARNTPMQRNTRMARNGGRGGHVAWRGGHPVRDHRRWSGRQHGGHVRRPARRRGDDDRARRRRRRRPPVGLHPVEDDDRHRRGDGVPAGARPGWASSRRQREVDTEALAARIEGIKQHLQEGVTGLLSSQGVRMIRGTARFVGAARGRGHRRRRHRADRRSTTPSSPPARARASPSGARPTATAS